MFALVGALVVLVVGMMFNMINTLNKANQNKIEADEFKIGTSTEGTEIPIVFGTVKITNPIYTWVGDKSVQAIKKKGGK